MASLLFYSLFHCNADTASTVARNSGRLKIRDSIPLEPSGLS